MILQTPLENLCAIFQQCGRGEEFLDLFDPEAYLPPLEPNGHHRFLAKLMAQGLLRTVVTLSFDGLLEKALQQEGMRAGKDFHVFFREEDLKSLGGTQGTVRLIKINGSLFDRQRLRKHFRRPLWTGSDGFQYKVLRNLLSQETDLRVVLFAMDGSDWASLYPLLERLPIQDKEVIHLHNSPIFSLEGPGRSNGKDPFRKFSRALPLEVPESWFQGPPGETLSVETLSPEGPEDNKMPWLGKACCLLSEGWKAGQREAFLGFWLSAAGEQARAIEYFERAREKFRATKDYKSQAALLNGLGVSYAVLKEYPEAVEYHEQALKAAVLAEDAEEQAFTLARLGAVCNALGEYHEALDYYERLLKLSHLLQDGEIEVRALTGVGSLCLHLKKYPRAVECFQRALELAESQGDKKAQVSALTNLGSVYQCTGEFHQAADSLSRGRQLAEDLGDIPAQLNALVQLGNVRHSLGEYQQAITDYEQALALARKEKDPDHEGMILANLGTAWANLREYHEAVTRYRQALDLAERRGQKELSGILMANLGAAYRELKEYEKAVSAYEQALAHKRALGEKEEEGFLLGHLGSVYLKAEEPGKALKCFHKALDILQNLLAPNHLFIKTIEKNILKAKAALDLSGVASSSENIGKTGKETV